MVATDLPSICRWKARFHPKLGTLFTTTRPSGGLACATVLIEIAHTKARIRRALLPKLRLDVIGDITHKTRFSPARMWTNRRKSSPDDPRASHQKTDFWNEMRIIRFGELWGLRVNAKYEDPRAE